MFIKGKIVRLMLIAAMCPPSQPAWGMPTANKDEKDAASVVGTVIERIENLTPFAADVTYAVSLPMADDDVVYDVRLASENAEDDPLSPDDYLIEWSLPRGDDASEGFSAYFDGHHYRYRDHRLQEYHFEWDSIPLIAGDGGVQRNGQFVDLLPHSIAASLRGMVASDDYTVRCEPTAVVDGRDVSVVMASQIVNGYVGRNYRLIVDRSTYRPLKIENEYNPGAISEQSVVATYSYVETPSVSVAKNEESLMAMYPEVFEKFRESNYRIENMRGLPLPGFSLPTLTAERYSRQRGDAFKAPTVIAMIDPQVATAQVTITALRTAQASMPRDIDLIFAFMSSNTDAVEEAVGTPAYGEIDLISAKSLARDCGTTVFPTILVVEPSGMVANVLLGFNNSLEQDVIQSLALIK